MNGRVYDPKLARFLQADPFIQAADNTQSYNRYSYVINNPLNATDPSGFIFGKIFKGLNKLLGDFAPFVSIALLAIPGVGAWAAASWQNAFAFGFVSGGISSGSMRGAVVGGLSATAFHGIGNKFVGAKGSGFFEKGGLGHIGAHGTVGGVSSVLQGGKFGHGFASAGITKASGVNDILGDDTTLSADTVRVAAAALVGGTVSEITGGKFANGATTAALAQALNDNASKQREADARAAHEQAECRGMCHGIPGRGDWQPMSDSQNMSLVSATLSSAGAGFAGIGCGSTGLSCGLAGVLSADAVRQFHKAGTGNDPLVRMSLDLGATERQAANIALGADFLTAATSINGAFKGMLFRSTQSLSAGSLGAAHTDVFSTIHTIGELNRSVESAQ